MEFNTAEKYATGGALGVLLFLLVFAGLGIWKVVDWLNASDAAREAEVVKQKQAAGFTDTKQQQLGDFQIIKFSYDNHSYIRFVELTSHSGRMGVVHDPDCKCHIENK